MGQASRARQLIPSSRGSRKHGVVEDMQDAVHDRVSRVQAGVTRGAGHTAVDAAVALEHHKWRANNRNDLGGYAEGVAEDVAAAGMRVAGHLAVDGAVLVK